MDDPPAARHLDDAAVEQRLAALDELLGHLEQTPGRTAETALRAIEMLTEVYGEALARVTDLAAEAPAVLAGLVGDELLRHLLLLHAVHPHPVERRVGRAVEDLEPRVRSQGARIEVIDIRDGVAWISMESGSCGSCGSGETLRELVRDEVLAVAPELRAVEVVTARPAPTLIPVESLRTVRGRAETRRRR